MKIKELFRNKSLGFYIGLGTASIALLANIAFIIGGLILYYTSETDAHVWERSFSPVTITLIFLGVFAQILALFKDYKFLPLLPVIFYSIAFGQHFYYASFAFANVLTGIDFFRDNLAFATIFFFLFLISGLGSVVSSFMRQTKQID